MADAILYFAKVPHNPIPIAFKLSLCRNKQFIFENMQHDFPNKIEYRQIHSNTLQVIVSGKTEKSFTIQLYRVQNNANIYQ